MGRAVGAGGVGGGEEAQHFYERRPGDAAAGLPSGYRRREPEKTVLYSVVQEHLLKRVFKIDVLVCARCGACMKVVAFITSAAASARILGHLGLRVRAPPIAKARAPPQLSFSA